MPDEHLETYGDQNYAISAIADAVVEKVVDPRTQEKVKKAERESRTEQLKDDAELGWKTLDLFVQKAVETVINVTGGSSSILDPLARGAIDSLLSSDVSGRTVGQNAGARLLSKVAGSQAAMEPGTAGAERYLTIVLHEEVEAWLRGVLVELVTEFMPRLIPLGGGVETVQKLQDIIETALGGGRMVRRVLQPFISATAITPARWHVNKQYRPELLSPAAAIEAFLAGRFTAPQLVEELARQGWSDERINIQVANARKRLSFADLMYQHFRGRFSDLEVLQRASELGYDENTARELFDLETAKRQDRWKDPLTDAAVAAFIDDVIDADELRRLVEANAPSHSEAQFIILTAKTRRGYRRRHLSSDDVRRLVIKDVLSVFDYRRALEREGYTEVAISALELELRVDLDAKHDRAAALARQQAERIAEEDARAEAKRMRDEELAARNALPALNEYRRAYTRGLITRDAFASAIAREKMAIGGEDLEILLADADVDRERYLDAIERQAAAAAAKPDPVLPLDKYEAAVVAETLTLEQYARELVARGYDDQEQQVLTALLADRLAQRDEAEKARAAAAAKAEQRAKDAEAKAAAAEQRAQDQAAIAGATLPAFERAVRLGLRTSAQYAAFLDQVETSEVGKALILDLLTAQIAQDNAARAKREAADTGEPALGLTLTQRRRAVLAGVRPRAYYEAALRAAGYAADDQLVELALLELEIAEDAANRERRAAIAAEHEAARLAKEAADAERAAATDAPPPPPTLSLVQLERAVTLGLLAPDALRAELEAKGYDQADVELLVAMVVARIPDTRVAERRWTEVAAELQAKGVSLVDLERAVKAGFRTLDDYQGELAARGFGDDDQLLLRELLVDEIALEQLRMRTAIEARLKKMDEAPPLEEIHAAVNAGELDAAQLRDVLVRFGVDPTTALLYARMVFAFGTEV